MQRSQQTSHSDILLKNCSLNRCRKKVRTERALHLKECLITASKNHDHENKLFRVLPDLYKKGSAPTQMISTLAEIIPAAAAVEESGVLNKRIKPLFVDAHSKRLDSSSTLSRPTKVKSVWRGVTNTVMRHGSKVKYQTMVRKVLLSL